MDHAARSSRDLSTGSFDRKRKRPRRLEGARLRGSLRQRKRFPAQYANDHCALLVICRGRRHPITLRTSEKGARAALQVKSALCLLRIRSSRQPRSLPRMWSRPVSAHCYCFGASAAFRIFTRISLNCTSVGGPLCSCNPRIPCESNCFGSLSITSAARRSSTFNVRRWPTQIR